MSKREIISERLECMEESALFMDDFDDAIIGVTIAGTGKPKVVYDQMKCIEILMRDGIPNWEEAVEYFEYNTVRACMYMGEDSPIIIDCLEEGI